MKEIRSKAKSENAGRRLWEKHYGEIPKGWHIHHIDGDHDNHVLANLECITTKQHGERHRSLGMLHDSNREKLEGRKKQMRERLAVNIKFYMSQAEVDIKSLAKLSGVAERSIHRLFRAEINASLYTMTQIADALDLSPAVLLFKPEPYMTPME